MRLLEDFDDLLDLFFPKFCPLCGKPLKREEKICNECKAKIEPLPYKERVKGKWFFDDFFYRGSYKGVLGELIRVYKFAPRPSLSELLSDLFLEMFQRFPPVQNATLTCVPPTFKSLKEKGFDHMRLLSKKISRKSDVPFLKLLEVKKQKNYQVGKSREDRKVNVVSKYEVSVRKLYQTSGRIILIDDVFTTGATLNECSKILKEAGAIHVSVYTLAKS